MRAWSIAVIWLLTHPALADPQPLLDVNLQGLQGELSDNALAYLGEAPESDAERSNFLFSARRNVEQSLHALGYYEPFIEINVDRNEPVWRLDIVVEPGEPVLLDRVNVTVHGAAKDDEAFAQLLENIPLRSGDPLHHGTYEAFKQSIQSLGRERGYFTGVMLESEVGVDIDAGLAVVDISYNSGERFVFGEVTLDAFPLQADRILQLKNFQEGDKFDIADIQDFQIALQRTGYFGTALVRPQPPDIESNTVPVHVELLPAVRHSYRLGLGFSTDTQERISLTWRTPLINTRGHRQETRLEYSPIRPSGRFTYTIPLSHPLNDILQLRARVENNEYGDLESFQREAAVAREFLAGDWLLSTSLRYLIEDWDVGRQNKKNTYTLPGVTFAHNRRDANILDPESGFSQLYGAELGSADVGSDLSLLRLYANWRGVYTLKPRHRLVGRADLGAVFFENADRPDLAPSLSFFAGGAYSIRGYAYQSLGPTAEAGIPGAGSEKLVVGGDRLAIASGEYQYYVNERWRAALFVDAGNAFNGNNFDPVVGAGVGAHYISPVGAIRLDLGNSISEDNPSWRIHITMGAEF